MLQVRFNVTLNMWAVLRGFTAVALFQDLPDAVDFWATH